MKKLIAIAVVFALVAGVAFAEVNVNADVFAKITPLYGDSSEANKDKVFASGDWTRIRAEISGQDDNGVFGLYARIDKSPWWSGLDSNAPAFTGNVWWKPIDQFKLTLGGNGKDGFFGADGVTRWGFYQIGADGVGVFSEGWKFSSSFYGGFDALGGAILTITPMDALEINLGIPLWDSGEAKDVYAKINAQVAYNISGIGKVALTYAGGRGYKYTAEVPPTAKLDPDKGGSPAAAAVPGWDLRVKGTPDTPPIATTSPSDVEVWWNPNKTPAKTAVPGTPTWVLEGGSPAEEVEDPGKFYFYFGLSAIENLGIDFGVGFTLPYETDAKVKVNTPVAIGLGVNFGAGAFGIKTRVQGQFGGSKGDAKDATLVDFDIMPSYAINDKLTAVFDAGIAITAPDGGDSVVGWHIEPAVTLKSNWWAPNLYAGIRIESDGVKGSSGNGDASKVSWSIPIGIAASF